VKPITEGTLHCTGGKQCYSLARQEIGVWWLLLLLLLLL
jgi:hypothetical protein